MTDQILTLYVHPTWLLNANVREHWARKAEKSRNLRGLAHAEARRQGLIPVTCQQQVTVTFGFITTTRRDVANWAPTAKACIDGGLVDSGVLQDDDTTWLVGPDLRIGHLSTDVHSDRPPSSRRVQVTIFMSDADREVGAA